MKNQNLEIGPGRKTKPGWDTLNIVRPATYVHDICRIPYPIDSDRYDAIMASHVLEHAPWFQAVEILKEWRRILKVDGTLEVWVPDFQKIVDGYRFGSIPQRDKWRKHNPDGNLMKWVNGRIFTYGPDPNWHRAVFDRDYLIDCFIDAGFFDLTFPERDGKGHGWIEIGLKGVK